MIQSPLKVCMLHTIFMQMKNYVYVGIDPATRKAFVVDPAWDIRKIEQCLEQENAVLDKVLLTHSHIDHVNLANQLAKKYNVPVYMSQEEIDYYKFRCANLQSFCDKEMITVGTKNIRCLVTPGHTKGGACYLVEEHAFTGDTLFIEGCGMCKLPGGSALEMFYSLQRLKKEFTAETRIYPGHRYVDMPGQTMEYVKEHNIYLAMNDKEHFIAFRNRKKIKGLLSFK